MCKGKIREALPRDIFFGRLLMLGEVGTLCVRRTKEWRRKRKLDFLDVDWLLICRISRGFLCQQDRTCNVRGGTPGPFKQAQGGSPPFRKNKKKYVVKRESDPTETRTSWNDHRTKQSPSQESTEGYSTVDERKRSIIVIQSEENKNYALKRKGKKIQRKKPCPGY